MVDGHLEVDKGEAFAANPPATLSGAAEMATLMRDLFCEEGCDLLQVRMIDSLATALERLRAEARDTAKAA